MVTRREIIIYIILLGIIVYKHFQIPETIIKTQRDYKYEDLLIRQNNDLSNKIDRLEVENEKLERKYLDSKEREKKNTITHENNLRTIDSADVDRQDSILLSNLKFLRESR